MHTTRRNAKSRGLPPAFWNVQVAGMHWCQEQHLNGWNALMSRATLKWRLWNKLLSDAVYIPAFRSMALTSYVIWPWPSKLPRRDLRARVCHVTGYIIIERRWVHTESRHERIRIWKEAICVQVLSQDSRDADKTSVRINDNLSEIRIGLLRRAVRVTDGWWSIVWPDDTGLLRIVHIRYWLFLSCFSFSQTFLMKTLGIDRD
jgi:hypothetical protein